jgi:hypothetical protein
VLTRRTRLRLALATLFTGVLAATGGMVIGGSEVFAAPPDCATTPDSTDCGLGGGGSSTNPGGGGGNPGGGGGGSGTCSWKGAQVACYVEGAGSFNANDGCYYRVAVPQGVGTPEGMTNYYKSCIDNNFVQESVDLADPPVLFVPDPAEMAWDLFARMVFDPPAIEITPKASGVLGMPVWMRIGDGWAPPPAESDTEAGLTVELVATTSRAEWVMGDGTTVTCTSAGQAWTSDKGVTPSSSCGYPMTGSNAGGYQQASVDAGQPNGYVIQVTVFFELAWTASDGQTGVLPDVQSPTSQVNYVVNELQVVNR